MKLFSGALPDTQELLSAHHSASLAQLLLSDLPENELLSLTQTHSPDPAEIALQESEHRDKCPGWNDILQARKLRHGVCPVLSSRAPSPHVAIPCLPREGRTLNTNTFTTGTG